MKIVSHRIEPDGRELFKFALTSKEREVVRNAVDAYIDKEAAYYYCNPRLNDCNAIRDGIDNFMQELTGSEMTIMIVAILKGKKAGICEPGFVDSVVDWYREV